MITNFSFGVPCETADADYPMPLGDYFDIEKDMMQVGGEFLLVRDEESNFYFLCTDDCDIEILCRAYDWYIVSSGRFNGRLRIGMGLAGEDAYGSEMFRVEDEQTLRLWHDILKFTFKGDFIRNYYPMTNRFRGKLRVDGALCFYIHNYYPVSHKLKLTSEQKKVTNLVFRFKEGACASLATKLFPLAISRMEFFNDLADPILLPLPAFTKERYRQRFESFCGELSRRLIIDNGFPAVRIEYDREQQKGTQQRDMSGIVFDPDYIEGRDVLLIDDILTTGMSFTLIKREFEKLGANSVIGIFLAKTV